MGLVPFLNQLSWVLVGIKPSTRWEGKEIVTGRVPQAKGFDSAG
jgi:hypothetical protein